MQVKRILFASLAFTLLTLVSCKKDDVSEPADAAQMDVHADDQAQFSAETDAVADDANKAIESNPYFSGKLSTVQTICDATIAVDTVSNPRTITITYLGTNCIGNRTRTGVVILSMPAGMHWASAGAALTITYQNLKITRVSDNKSIIINGSKTITNVTGGKLFQLPTMGTIIHNIASSNMSVKFNDSTTRNWNIARKRTFTYNNGIVLTVTGTHSAGGYTNICEWGTNRFGQPFVTAITQPMVVRQDCNFRLTHGQLTHHTGQVHAVLTYGLDASGNPTGCPGTGHYYFKIVVTGPNGFTHTAIHPYH
ncbi:MAG TPA: hypothetical protein VFZ78_06600 [Flavisolibacter sp.]